MNLQEESENKSLAKVYLEASQWVRSANSILWSMGTLLVPVSFGLVGLALNRVSDIKFEPGGKWILGLGSIFLFSFWVYASRLYQRSSRVARNVLIEIERKWGVPKEIALYALQEPLINRKVGLLPLQIITLAGLILIWAVILYFKL